jgi:hypothetical protein
MRLRRSIMVTCIALIAFAACAVRAEEPPDLRRLFPHTADVRVSPAARLVRLDLPLEVLTTCRSDLSDLRILDLNGREVPFVIDTGLKPASPTWVRETAEGTLLDVRTEEIRRDAGPPLRRETYEVAAPTNPPQSGAWDLIVTTERPSFVRRVDVAAKETDGSAVALVTNGSLFILANPRREKTRLTLPAFSGDRLTVTLEGEDGVYLEPRFRFESARAIEPSARIVVPLEEVGRRRANDRTIVELARPAGVVPDGLRVETTSGFFDRDVEVWDDGGGGSAMVVGRARIFRVEAPAMVEEREIGLPTARGERLRVEIVDGDSPTLEGLSFSALVRQPSLVFSLASATGDGPAGALLFGGGRAYAPRYDLAGLMSALDPSARDERTSAAVRLRDPSIDRADLGPIRANPAFDGAPVLGFAMRPGTDIDVRSYTHRRPLTVVPSADGLSRLRLRPADLALARPDLADLRIVDAASHQWPYLLERNAATEWQELDVGVPTRKRGTSRYELALPVVPLGFDQVVLETRAPFFDRAYRLLGKSGNEAQRTLAEGRLARVGGRTQSVILDVAPTRIDALALVVEDGDDAPLAFDTVRVRLQLPDLFLVAPAGAYALVLGDPESGPPEYELGRARQLVLAVSSAPVVTGDLVRNPEYSLRARIQSGDRARKILLWAVLLLAVVVLTVVTLRAARREETVGGDTP